MKYLLFFPFIFLLGCNSFPHLFQDTADGILDDKTVELMIYRDAIQKQTNMNITIEVKNNREEKEIKLQKKTFLIIRR